MTDTEFKPWPKIARLNRDIVVTEKLDGTNAAVLIVEVEPQDAGTSDKIATVSYTGEDDVTRKYHVYAQSRTRFVTPAADNHGFAKWVEKEAAPLVHVLGEGRHFGEWWGSGIQRGYGMPKDAKFFSLFNVSKWGDVDLSLVDGLGVVPVLYEGPFSQDEIVVAQSLLRMHGSEAAAIEGITFMDPEGVVVFHTASNHLYKVTIKGDEKPKGQN